VIRRHKHYACLDFVWWRGEWRLWQEHLETIKLDRSVAWRNLQPNALQLRK
jgi:hypothetical protein